MPETEPEAVERLLAETAEARDLLRLHPNFTIGPAHDVRGLVDYGRPRRRAGPGGLCWRCRTRCGAGA